MKVISPVLDSLLLQLYIRLSFPCLVSPINQSSKAFLLSSLSSYQLDPSPLFTRTHSHTLVQRVYTLPHPGFMITAAEKLLVLPCQP
jgi:hypothetical protein